MTERTDWTCRSPLIFSLIIATYYISLLTIAGILEGSLLLFELIRPVPVWQTSNLQPQCPMGAGWQCVSAVSFLPVVKERLLCFFLFPPLPRQGRRFVFLAACIRRLLAGWHSNVMLRSPAAIYLYLFTFWNWQHPISLVIPQSTAECLAIWLLAVTVVYSYMLK